MSQSTVTDITSEGSNDILYTVLLAIFISLVIFFISYPFTTYKGPDSNIIRKQIYRYNGKCYKLEPVVHMCPASYKSSHILA